MQTLELHPSSAAEIDLLNPGLAALVVRLAQMSLVKGRMISGTSWTHRSRVGLRSEDRRAMGAEFC